MGTFPRVGGPGIGLNLLNQVTNVLTLQASEIYLIPSGEYACAPGPYTDLQFLDPLTGRWETINAQPSLAPHFIDSDGTNFRLANLTGTPVGAAITAAGNGTGLTNGIGTAATGLTVTVSAGASTWVPVVGGAVNPTVTISAGGSSYQYPPHVLISPPPSGGIQATGFSTITSNTLNSVTIVNQGAGYTVAPTITFVNDQRDTLGSGASATINATLFGNTQVTALYPSNSGTALTAVPTFTFSPTSAITATAIMNFTATGVSTVGAGTTFANPVATGMPAPITGFGSRVTAGIAGPIMDVNLTQPRPCWISITASASALTTTATIVDAGYGFQQTFTPWVLAGLGSVPNGGTVGAVTLTWGGQTDTCYLQPL